MNTNDYRLAPGGDGPLADIWADKPHRLIYDLANAVDNLQAIISHVADRLYKLPEAYNNVQLRAAIETLRKAASEELDVRTSVNWQMYLDAREPDKRFLEEGEQLQKLLKENPTLIKIVRPGGEGSKG